MAVPIKPAERIASLDQFRGYTVLGMLLVNFIGDFHAIPAIFKHHNTYCSYADTIMPQFFFAVGYAYRLTLVRRLASGGVAGAYGRPIRRCLGLILLGVVVYHLDGGARHWVELQSMGLMGFMRSAFQRNVFQTLVHIGLTTLWVMPVMAAGPWVRVVFASASGILHVILSFEFYYDCVMHRPGIDGGPLGFLTWTIPLLVGSLACDAMRGERTPPEKIPEFAGMQTAQEVRGNKVWLELLGWGAGLMVLGYALSCLSLAMPPANLDIGSESRAAPTESSWWVEPPFVPPTRSINYWTMSQRAGSVSYLTFGAGLSLAIFALFVWICDCGSARVGVFSTFGSNALAVYLIHDLVIEAMRPYTPRDSPIWFAISTFALFLGVCYVFVRYLEKNSIFLRL